MASCSRVSECPLFKVFTMNASLKLWKTLYCEAQFARCERFKLAGTGQRVPGNLLPNGRTLASTQVPKA